MPPTGCCTVNTYDRRHHDTRCPNHPGLRPPLWTRVLTAILKKATR